MLVTKEAPQGMDFYIQQAQTKLYNGLLKAWGGISYNCYGRCYRNRGLNEIPEGRRMAEPNYIAEVYTGNGQYQEAYWDSSVDAVSFFGISYSQKEEAKRANHTVDVHLVFFVNIATVKPLIAHRGDEEVRQDVYNILGPDSFGLSFQSVELWMENILKEYPGTRTSEGMKHVDMHPVHAFRLNYQLSFNPNKTQIKF